MDSICLPIIDSTRIGISGHSQGGWIAQIVAAQHEDIAFIIALAGPTVRVRAQTGSNDSLYYMCKGYSGERLVKRMKRDRNKKTRVIGPEKIFHLSEAPDSGT